MIINKIPSIYSIHLLLLTIISYSVSNKYFDAVKNLALLTKQTGSR